MIVMIVVRMKIVMIISYMYNDSGTMTSVQVKIILMRMIVRKIRMMIMGIIRKIRKMTKMISQGYAGAVHSDSHPYSAKGIFR